MKWAEVESLMSHRAEGKCFGEKLVFEELKTINEYYSSNAGHDPVSFFMFWLKG